MGQKENDPCGIQGSLIGITCLKAVFYSCPPNGVHFTPEEFYKQQFLRFEEGALREGAALDKTIFWAGTGTLVLSVNYIIGLKDTHLVFPYILILAWIFLLFSITAQIIGYKFSKTFHIKVIDDLNNWARDGSRPIHFLKPENTVKYSRWSNRLTNWSLYLLIAGLFFITMFTIFNFLIHNKIVYNFNF